MHPYRAQQEAVVQEVDAFDGETTVRTGWRADPTRPDLERWWDGVGWTEHLRRRPTMSGASSSLNRYGSVRSGAARPAAVDAATTPAWWIACWPLWTGLVSFVLHVFAFVSSLADVVLITFQLAAAVGLLVLAGADRSRLRAAGVSTTPSPVWMLGTPLVYLAVRWLVLRPRPGSAGPLVALLVQVALIAAALFLMQGVAGLLAVVSHAG